MTELLPQTANNTTGFLLLALWWRVWFIFLNMNWITWMNQPLKRWPSRAKRRRMSGTRRSSCWCWVHKQSSADRAELHLLSCASLLHYALMFAHQTTSTAFFAQPQVWTVTLQLVIFFIINSFVSSFLRESIKLPRKCNQRQREEHSRINWGDVFSLKTRNHKRSRKMFSDHWPPAQTLIQWIRFFFVGPPFAAYPLWDQLSWAESAATYKRLKRFIFKHINRVTEWQLVTWSVFAAFQPLSKGGLEYLTSCWATRKH